MTEPTIICPNCKTEIKLTESLAAPLIQSTRKEYEQRIVAKEIEVANRKAAKRDQQAAVAKAKEAIDDEVALKLKEGMSNIIAAEAKKARMLVADDLER